ncbi:MAG TPA: DUF6089 family protein [Ferruginibacter sp.]|nr:DUF6089 family protein [Ferruginibacter sp.]
MCAKKIGRTALFTLSIFSFFQANAQSSSAKYELGANIGAYVYQGDLSPQRFGSLKTIKPGIGISFARIISPSFSVGALFNLASLKGDETKYDNPEYRQQRAFKFKSSLKELGLVAKWNVLGSSTYETKLEPYLFAGVSLAFIKTTTDYSAFNPAYFGEANEITAGLVTDAAEPARKTIPVIPAGLGLRYNLSSTLSLNMESSYRFTGSDYIDGYSMAANPAKNDHYFSQTIGISKKLGKKDKLGCPVMKF